MNAINELDTVALTLDLPEHGLQRGDVGAVVLIHGNGRGYEVEFIGYDGNTLALLSLEAEQVRLLTGQDIPHVRSLAPASPVAEPAYSSAMSELGTGLG